MTVEAVILDLDGTLIGPAGEPVDGVAQMMETLSVPALVQERSRDGCRAGKGGSSRNEYESRTARAL